MKYETYHYMIIYLFLIILVLLFLMSIIFTYIDGNKKINLCNSKNMDYNGEDKCTKYLENNQVEAYKIEEFNGIYNINIYPSKE
jgi:hypothetical protein